MKHCQIFCLFLIWILLQTPKACADHSSSWDLPLPVGPNTVFFGESAPPGKAVLEDKPVHGDKSYPWYYLKKGNEHFLACEWDRAEMSYREAYSVPGPVRVLSGFKLIETLERMGRVDSALEILDQMEKQYLIGSREFQEARRMRMTLLDEKRKGAVEKKMEPFMGRDWLMQISAWRTRFALDGMEVLRVHGVPLKEPYQRYAFLLDEYFLAHPEASASDPAVSLAALIYERDPEARIPLDRWRLGPLEKTPIPSLDFFDKHPPKITGAEWIVMVHSAKMAYVDEAMTVLRNQRVPIKKSLYAYVDALDKLFTDKPELPAFDSVASLASLLYESEPEAKQVLEALRLE